MRRRGNTAKRAVLVQVDGALAQGALARLSKICLRAFSTYSGHNSKKKIIIDHYGYERQH